MMIILGIDPGLTGAVSAFICGEFNIQFDNVYDMPKIETGKGGSKVKNQVDAHALGKIIQNYSKNNIHVVAYVEKVHTMPAMTFNKGKMIKSQGIASNGSLMHSLGVVEGALGMAQIKTVMVTPQKWKKHWGLINTSKNDAVLLARKEFPDAPLSLLKHSGRADAILIGAFGSKINKFLEA